MVFQLQIDLLGRAEHVAPHLPIFFVFSHIKFGGGPARERRRHDTLSRAAWALWRPHRRHRRDHVKFKFIFRAESAPALLDRVDLLLDLELVDRACVASS